MANRKQFAIVAKKRNNQLMLLSPNGQVKYFVDESLLADHNIHLGDCCYFTIIIGNPEEFRKFDGKFDDDVRFEVNENAVVISNVPGEMEKVQRTQEIFFNTRHFGKVAYLGEEQELNRMGINETRKKFRTAAEVIYGRYLNYVYCRLDEEDKTGFFTNSTWSGTVQKTIASREPSSARKSFEEKAHKVIGLVAAQAGGGKKYVWAKETYPGVDGMIETPENSSSVPIGTWIEMTFDEVQFQCYFPSNPNERTSRFITSNFKEIPPIYKTEIGRNGNNVVVHLDNLMIDEHHNSGDDLEHPVLGLISDYLSIVRFGPGKYNIEISRGLPKPAKSGRMTVWKVVKANKVESTNFGQGFNDGARNNRAMSRSTVRDHRRTPSSVRQNIPDPSRERSQSRGSVSSRQRSLSVVSSASSQRASYRPRHTEARDQKEKFSKQAVIVSIIQNKFVKEGRTYFLWLIDDHMKSIYHTKLSSPDLKVGHIFGGTFVKSSKNSGQFECISHDYPLNDELIDVSTRCVQNQLEMVVTVYGRNRKNSTTHHNFIGDIYDVYELLPYDCSGGVRIVTISRKEDKGKWILKEIVSKEMELIEEFYRAWKIPILKKNLEADNSDKNVMLKNYYDESKLIFF